MGNPSASASGEDALTIARRWDPAAAAVEAIRDGESSVWRVRSPRGDSALRLTSAARRSSVRIEAELAFVDHLAAAGVRVAPVRRTESGEVLLVIGSAGGGEKVATCFGWLPGRHFEYHSPDIGPRLFRAWGGALARLHDSSRGFEPAAGAARPEWTEDEVAACEVEGAHLPRRIVSERDETVAWLRETPVDPIQYGMVHGDFERTNFLIDDGRIAVFDFDDCCRHWFAWDIACALWAFRNAPTGDRVRFLAWLMEGYGAVREPDAERLSRFSALVRLRTIALLLHRLRDHARLARPLDPEWVDRTQRWLLSDWRWGGRDSSG